MGTEEVPPPLAAKLVQYQLVNTSGDERVNLLLNIMLLFSVPPLGAFIIYFILSTLMIWCVALFAQLLSLIVGFVVLVPALICSCTLGFIVTSVILHTRARWQLK